MQIVVNANSAAGPEIARIAVAAEDAGADAVWVPEAYGWEAIARLGYLAAVTERVRLATAIVNVYSRSPTLIAQAAATLDALSGGRFELGLGTSGPQVVEGWYGVPFEQPLARLADTVEVCRKVWRREVVRHTGTAVTLPLPDGRGTGLGKPLKLLPEPVRDAVPVWVAALGPRSVRFTAATADGWFPIFYPMSGPLPDVWTSALADGRGERAAELGPLRICAGGPVVVSDDATLIEAARERWRERIAHYVGLMGAPSRNFYRSLVERLGYPAEAAEIHRRMRADGPVAAAGAVPDGLVDAVSLCVEPTALVGRLRAAHGNGVTHLRVDTSGADWQSTVAALRAAVDAERARE
ncbi:LLM class F420-dependent oxidoreductase [Actinomadura sp. KC345]|uniref:LLM class F420-dependent oxidoreductase n=1 Tax=Actinomadura sp. KC345 TaxID=2530371 RepID=UPI00104B6607|nr:LLM class F420-dependent oxidoreductase [Actinomadura sp. KC345]TDC57905.1 LLM class F420-dependent oxidoreductase [Actinomadura sp. KC345]